MKKFRLTFLKPSALFFATAILFQCCMVYDKQPVTIDDAINIDHKKVKRIKIDMTGNKKIIFDSIYYRDNQLFGLKLKPKEKTNNAAAGDQNATGDKISKKGIEIQINEDDIIQIRLHNKSKTLTLNIFIAVIGGLAIFIGGHLVAFAFPAD